MLKKYNFITSIRGMFLPAPILWPRRFNYVSGAWVQVNPTVNGLPAEVGSYSGLNPAYEMATHEEVLMHGKYPFKVMYLPTEQTLGENSSFGPESSFFDSLQWVNPQTQQDPFRRVGYYATSATIGISQQFSEGAFGVLVERPDVRTTAVFPPEPECPPTPVDCDNSVPAVSCPCPAVLSSIPNPVTPGNYFLTFAVPTDAVAEDSIQLGLDTGGYITGTVVSVSTDGFVAEVTFTSICPDCVHFTSVYCNDTLGCSSDVLATKLCENVSGVPSILLTLKNAIKATASDEVTVYFCDGTSATATVSAVDDCSKTYTVALSGVTCYDSSNIVFVCVPPGTDASCPACGGGPTITYCVS
jgi:hypothetical protein